MLIKRILIRLEDVDLIGFPLVAPAGVKIPLTRKTLFVSIAGNISVLGL